MTNHPRYSPPPPQPGYRPGPSQPGAPGYTGTGQIPVSHTGTGQIPVSHTGSGQIPVSHPGTGQIPVSHTGSGQIPVSHPGTGQIPTGAHQTYAQHDWRYSQQSPYRAPYDPYRATQTGSLPGQPPPAIRQKRSSAGLLTVGALVVAVMSAGIGGGVATVVEQGRHAAGGLSDPSTGGAAPSVPAEIGRAHV